MSFVNFGVLNRKNKFWKSFFHKQFLPLKYHAICIKVTVQAFTKRREYGEIGYLKSQLFYWLNTAKNVYDILINSSSITKNIFSTFDLKLIQIKTSLLSIPVMFLIGICTRSWNILIKFLCGEKSWKSSFLKFIFDKLLN